MTVSSAIIIHLNFRDVSEKPIQPGTSHYETALLYNQCDGFHIAFARWDAETGEFAGFFDWSAATVPWEAWKTDSFCAWALLPFATMKEPLFTAFARGPRVADGVAASENTSPNGGSSDGR
jgi:hypothetical protein